MGIVKTTPCNDTVNMVEKYTDGELTGVDMSVKEELCRYFFFGIPT